MRTTTTRIGQIVAGRHRILERIGSGAMGEVFRASAVDARGAAGQAKDDEVAIKILRPERAQEREAVARFLAEVRALRSLSHPAIVRVLDAGETDDHAPYVVMELLRGESLRTTLQRHGRMDRATAISLLLPVLEALEAAHEHGVIHRDVKPENVHLSINTSGDVEVKVLDFGIAKVLDAKDNSAHKTTQGVVVGTPGYFAPEQASGDRALDGRVDLFAAGTILFELLTGVRAFDGPSPVLAAWKVVSEPAPRLVDSGVEAAADLQLILDRALAKKPDERFPNARAFLDAVTPLAPSDIGRRVLLSSLVASPGRAQRPPPPPSEPAEPANVQVSKGPGTKAAPIAAVATPTPVFLPTMKSTTDPLAAKLDARASMPAKRAVRLAEEASNVDTPALEIPLDSSDVLESIATPPPTSSLSPLELPLAHRGKYRARAGWIRSLVNGLERVHSVAVVSSWIDSLPAAHTSAIRVASLDPDAWAPFDALHAFLALATEQAFGGDATNLHLYTRDHAHDLAARMDRWAPTGALGSHLPSSQAASAWWDWWPGARASLFDVGSARVESVTADQAHAETPRSVIVVVDDVGAAAPATRYAELGLLEAILARAGFAAAVAEPLPGATDLGQEFRYRVAWG